MVVLLGVILGTVVFFGLLIGYAIFVLSGQISRDEDEREKKE